MVDVEVVGVPFLSNQIRCFGIPGRCGKAHYRGSASSRLASKSKADSMGRIVTGSLHGFGVVPATAAGFVISMCFNPIPNRVLAPRSLFETFWDLRS